MMGSRSPGCQSGEVSKEKVWDGGEDWGWQGAGEVADGVACTPEKGNEALGPLSGSANYNKNAWA